MSLNLSLGHQLIHQSTSLLFKKHFSRGTITLLMPNIHE